MNAGHVETGIFSYFEKTVKNKVVYEVYKKKNHTYLVYWHISGKKIFRDLEHDAIVLIGVDKFYITQ